MVEAFTLKAQVGIVEAMEKEYQIANPTDFQKMIEDIFAWYQSKGTDTLVIALQGDLGAGKTTFTQELGRYLKIIEPITSPTFTIMKRYELKHEQFDQLVHIDAYRFEDEKEAKPLQLQETIQQPRTIVCIEWPELIPSVIPETAVRIKLQIIADESRIATVELLPVK